MSDQLPCAAPDHAPHGHTVLHGHDRWHGLGGEFDVVQCSLCGLAGTVPRLAGDELWRYYPSDYYTNTAGAEPAAEGGPRGRVNARIGGLRTRLFERFGPFRDLYAAAPGRVLDVGCGAGDLGADFLARGWEVAGVEPGKAAAAAATARGIDVHPGTLDDTPWDDDSFDAVVFNHSLEHVPDPLGDLRAAERLTRAGGLVAVSVPNFGSWQRRLFGSRWFQLDLPRHLNHFDRRSLPALAERAGLAQHRVWSSSSLQGLPGSLQYALRGEMAWSPGTLYRLGYLLWPLALPLDRVAGGDCLHFVGVAS